MKLIPWWCPIIIIYYCVIGRWFLLVHTATTAYANRINELKAIETVFILMYWISRIFYWLRTSEIATNHGTQRLFIISQHIMAVQARKMRPNSLHLSFPYLIIFLLYSFMTKWSGFCQKYYTFHQYCGTVVLRDFLFFQKNASTSLINIHFVSSQLFEWKKYLSITLSFLSVWIDLFCVVFSKDSSFIRGCSRKSKSQFQTDQQLYLYYRIGHIGRSNNDIKWIRVNWE